MKNSTSLFYFFLIMLQAPVYSTSTKKEVCRLQKEVSNCCNCLSKKIQKLCKKISCQKIIICEILNDLRQTTTCRMYHPIAQKDIPYVITQPGFYCLVQDVTFNGASVPNPGTYGTMAIAINSNNVDLDLNEHTMTIAGANTNAIATLDSSSHIRIHDGIITGDNSNRQKGISALTSDIIINDVEIISAGGLNGGGIFVQGINIPSPILSLILMRH